MTYGVNDRVPTPGGEGKITAVLAGEIFEVTTWIKQGAFLRMPNFGRYHVRYLTAEEIDALKEQYDYD